VGKERESPGLDLMKAGASVTPHSSFLSSTYLPCLALRILFLSFSPSSQFFFFSFFDLNIDKPYTDICMHARWARQTERHQTSTDRLQSRAHAPDSQRVGHQFDADIRARQAGPRWGAGTRTVGAPTEKHQTPKACCITTAPNKPAVSDQTRNCPRG